MKWKKQIASDVSKTEVRQFETRLKKGDPVMVIAGGNPKKGRILKGQVGKILRFLPKSGRVVVEGVNLIKRHKRATTSQEKSGIVEREGSLPIASVMYYSDKAKKPVRLKVNTLQDGRKVRGYLDPKTKAFEQVDVA